ncbi:hypothetical protein [Nonomuraea sp. NPDC049504]|uniref:alpha/beta fold hydrolase n=1 Tax=Nonomuraea sp. NPDC049504 TaxID=3154729 RepID=UPI003441E3CF
MARRRAFARQDRVMAEVVDETWHRMSRPERPEAFIRLVRTQDYRPTDAGLGRLRARTLVIWGEDDQWLPAAYAGEYGRRIPGATSLTGELLLRPGAEISRRREADSLSDSGHAA